MALLRKIPLTPMDGFPFLERVNFETLAMRLAGRSLTQPAADAAPEEGTEPAKDVFHHLVGIQSNLERLGMILSSSQANNAWISGPKGVGKTVLIEALLRARAEKRLTSALMSKPYYLFDPNSFASESYGAGSVKKFDECLKKAAEGGGVLIIDHMDDFLKTAGPELGATLSSTLIKHLERNKDFQAIIVSNSDKKEVVQDSSTAIGRAFQTLELGKEPDDVALKQILVAKSKILDETHNVELTDASLDEIIRLLSRYPGRAFPGAKPHNAIKFADKVATYVHLNRYAEPLEVTETREKIRLLQDQLTILPGDQGAKRKEVEQQIADMTGVYGKLDAAWKDKFGPLLKARESFDNLNTKLDILRNKAQRTTAEAAQLNIYAGSYEKAKDKLAAEEKALYATPPRVEPKHVRFIFSQESGVPTSTLSEDKLEHLSKLDGYLDGEIMKQDDAKKSIGTAYFQREVGISDPSRPAGVFLFLGGTGLGKTELVKVLSRFDGGEGAEPVIIRLSEFKGKEAGKKLTGADPGLVGYEDGSCLDAVGKNPRAIVLFDEAEKGDPSVFDVAMQILEEAKLTPSNSKKPIEFKDTIIVFASNALKASDFSKEEMKDERLIRERLKKVINPDTGAPQFKPEFIARFDRVIVFEDLEPVDHVKIFQKEIRKINRDYSGRGISVTASDDVAAAIIKLHDDPTVGGRLSRNIANKHLRPLITEYLKEHIKEVMNEDVKFQARLRLEIDGDKITLEPIGPNAPAQAARPDTASNPHTPR